MRSNSSSPPTRRRFLAGVGWVVVSLGLGLHRRADARTEDGSVPDLLGIRPGTVIERWTVVEVHPVKLGAVPVVLATAEGTRFQIDVMARDDDGPSGVAQTERFGLYVRNRGDGQTATNEEQGLGAMSLARELRAREAQGRAAPELLTLRQRHRRHPYGAFGVPLS